jgi:hypothetical protein
LSISGARGVVSEIPAKGCLRIEVAIFIKEQPSDLESCGIGPAIVRVIREKLSPCPPCLVEPTHTHHRHRIVVTTIGHAKSANVD